MDKQKVGFASILVIFVIIAIVVAGIVFLIRSGIKINVSVPSSISASLNQDSLFSGKLTQLNQDLGLFKPISYNADNVLTQHVYYSAGVFTRGTLEGYTRIITMPLDTSLGQPYFILATKDFRYC